MRHMLVDGQGNFGSVDGDAPAAMRYTEIRLARISHELLADLDRETVDFGPNYDETETQPLVLPTRVPNLLVNGSAGIAVGMATTIPPHNLAEVINACLAMIDDDQIELDELLQHIQGPDFPTGGIINGASGIRQAYRTGRGRIYVRARVEIEEIGKHGDRHALVITELPYTVNKARLLEKIAGLVRDKKITSISDLRDESDKDGMRAVIELKRGEVPEVVLNNLYQMTSLQLVIGINMVALVNNQPRLFSLREMIEEFIKHRREVVTRRTIYDLRKARDRAHLLEGLAIALSNIDPIIALIKAAASPAEAKQQLLDRDWETGIVAGMLQRAGADMSRPDGLPDDVGMRDKGYRLSERQAQAILDLRLHRLTGLEQEKIISEYEQVLDRIAELLEILQSFARLMQVIRDELIEIRDKYGEPRRTEIVESYEDLTDEDLIAEEDMVVTLSHSGYAKSQPLQDYQAQRRGGRGKSATRVKEEDFVDSMFVANTHDTLLCFSTAGKVYWLKVYMLPQAGRLARGKPLNNLLPLEDDEVITAVLPVREYQEDRFVFMAMDDGVVKKTPLVDFSRPRSNGIRAVGLGDERRLVGVGVTDGEQDILLFSNAGKAVRFAESDVRAMGRTARGVRGIKLAEGDRVISVIIANAEQDADRTVLTATVNGHGKRTRLDQYPCKSRATKGVISIQTSERNGEVVAAELVDDNDEVMLITSGGTLIRTRIREISVLGRNTQGVRLIGLDSGEKLVSLARVCEAEEDEADAEQESNDNPTEED
jgi:DNA gyrase subunit A